MDSKDFQLLVAVHKDARQSMQSLGRRIGLTAPAVRERLKRLKELGVLPGYAIWVDPALFNRREVLAFFRGERTRNEVMRMLGERDVAWIGWKLDGGLTVGLWTNDTEVAIGNLESVLGEKSAGRAVTVSRPLPGANSLDWAIVEALSDDPKIPFKELIRRTGLSPKTVRKRLSLLLESESIVIMPRLGSTPDSGDLVYTLAVVGEVTMIALRGVLEDTFLLHQTHVPPMKYLLCRSPNLAEVIVKTKELSKLPGVELVNLSLNRELFFSSRLIHVLINQRLTNSDTANRLALETPA